MHSYSVEEQLSVRNWNFFRKAVNYKEFIVLLMKCFIDFFMYGENQSS